MRVLWFTNTFLPGQEESTVASLRHSGGWMVALRDALCERHPDVSLAIASTRSVSALERYASDGVECFAIPTRKKHSRREERAAVRSSADVVAAWRPDVIHVHGTERFFGLLAARGLVSAPTVVSIQGLVTPYAEWGHYFGNRSLRDLVRMQGAVLFGLGRGPLWDYVRFRRTARRETEIVRGNRYFMGRTDWDRAHLAWMNPKAHYYHVGELIRKPFWETRWDLATCQRHRLIFTNAGHPRKGADGLLTVADKLRQEFPRLHLAVAGDLGPSRGYSAYIRREIRKRADYVSELGGLNAEDLATELVRSHIFLSPSFIDNSPNAICEAQLVGTPVITSYTGGVPSLVAEGHSGLFYPSGDLPSLFAAIRRLFLDDDLAMALSTQGRQVARTRHDPEKVVSDLIRCYEAVCRPQN